MAMIDMHEIRKLSVEERIALVEAIWNSIADDAGALPLTDEQNVELERRLARYEANPERTRPWEEVRRDLDES